MPRRAVKAGVELVPLNMKVPKELRSRLEKAAKKSGRSLTSEAGYRVERGFDYEKLFGSEYTQILIRLIADAITLIERNTGKRWNEDPRVLERALHAVRLIADTADLVGTDPDKRPDDHQLAALKKAVGEPAETIVDLVTGDEELLALTERDIFKDATG
jgi:TraY domain